MVDWMKPTNNWYDGKMETLGQTPLGF